jgi:hypothetical protein
MRRPAERRDAMRLGPDPDWACWRVDLLNPGDPLGVVARVEHERGDLFGRPGNVRFN